jgi:hypothetical protein
MSLVDLEMLKLVQSPMKKVELCGLGGMATMESWVEVGTQSLFKFICIGD